MHNAPKHPTAASVLAALLLTSAFTACVVAPAPVNHVVDHAPDPTAPPRAGGPLPGLTAAQLALFNESVEAFNELDSVAGGHDTSAGLGPRFNLNSCSGCHAFPAVGGSSGLVNPEPVVAKLAGATNAIDFPFLRSDGPIVEVRFKSLTGADGNLLLDPTRRSGGRRPDGGVHALFTIAGRSDAAGCELAQPPFKQAWNNNNISLRIPTPLFGLAA